MIRVAFLQASLPVGGAERLVESLMRGFDAGRVTAAAVNLYAPGPIGEALATAGFEVRSGLAAHRFDPRAGGALARALAALESDVVYVADSAMPLFWAGWRRRRAKRPRLVVGFHSTGKRGDALQHAAAGAAAFPVADRFVALAPRHREFLCGRFRIDPARFVVIGNGVDLARFRPGAGPADRATMKRTLGLEAEERVVGIVAALRPEKNHELFLRCAARLAPRVPGTRFVIAGDGPERARLEQQTRALGLGACVRFLGTVRDTPALYRALDLTVLCSHPVVETFPMSLVESLASGVPVVSTRVGAVEDIVIEGETGELVPPGDEPALAAAIERRLLDVRGLIHMGERARADAERRFDRHTMLKGYERLFTEVARA